MCNENKIFPLSKIDGSTLTTTIKKFISSELAK